MKTQRLAPTKTKRKTAYRFTLTLDPPATFDALSVSHFVTNGMIEALRHIHAYWIPYFRDVPVLDCFRVRFGTMRLDRRPARNRRKKG